MSGKLANWILFPIIDLKWLWLLPDYFYTAFRACPFFARCGLEFIQELHLLIVTLNTVLIPRLSNMKSLTECTKRVGAAIEEQICRKSPKHPLQNPTWKLPPSPSSDSRQKHCEQNYLTPVCPLQCVMCRVQIFQWISKAWNWSLVHFCFCEARSLKVKSIL